MAARLNPRHQDSVRAKIKVASLIALLDKNAHGTLKNKNGEIYELSESRLKSAKILLDKSISNAPTELAGLGENGAIVFELKAPWLEAITKRRGLG